VCKEQAFTPFKKSLKQGLILIPTNNYTFVAQPKSGDARQATLAILAATLPPPLRFGETSRAMAEIANLLRKNARR
jgi:hypothetical protein